MRILFLTHRIPYPPNKGDKIRSFNILKYLSSRHEVHLACPIDDANDLKFVPEMKTWARSVSIARIDSPIRRVLALKSVATSRPITVDFFYAPELQRKVDALLAEHKFDGLLCYSSPMAEYLFRSAHWNTSIANTVKVMDFIDIDSYKWVQYSRDSPPWKAWIYRHEARTLGQYEQRIARAFDRLFVVSEQERGYFPGGAPDTLQAVSNGVDLEFFSPLYRSASTLPRDTLVFTGVMDYWPNIEGVKWFVERILPRIQATVPDARLYIVGSRPTSEIRRLQQSGVEVTGFVEDVRDYIAGASACVVPLRIARGVQNKVLEAMAMGKAVVSTPQAFEGIRAAASRDLLVAGNEEEFAAACIELLRDASRAQEIGGAARLSMEQHYSWERCLEPLEHWTTIGGIARLFKARA